MYEVSGSRQHEYIPNPSKTKFRSTDSAIKTQPDSAGTVEQAVLN